MFFKAVVNIVRFLVWIVNGKTEIQNKEYIPKDTVFILAAPHRSLLDPVFISFGVYPHIFSSMAKQELFKGKFITWVLTHMNAFPVNRENPGPSALKQPVSILKEGKTNLLIFPTGSRHSTEIKGGTSSIAKLANVPILSCLSRPAHIQDLILKRKKRQSASQAHIPAEGKADLREELAAYDECSDYFPSVGSGNRSELCM